MKISDDEIRELIRRGQAEYTRRGYEPRDMSDKPKIGLVTFCFYWLLDFIRYNWELGLILLVVGLLVMN